MNPAVETFRRALSEESRRLDVQLSHAQLDALCRHYELLSKWNARIRLVASADPVRAAIELFADSLIAAHVASPPGAEAPGGTSPEVIDIGAGAGFPGIPLKIYSPQNAITVIEANAKKCAYLQQACRELALPGTQVIRGRAEELARTNAFRERFDLAFCRATAPPMLACELAVPFLKVGGSFMAQTGELPRALFERLRKCGALLGATTDVTSTYKLSRMPAHRWLLRIKKHAATPPCYPRDTKTMKKKPLVP
jgi:16S rRNA (guanine527-N7)-methyltransferase